MMKIEEGNIYFNKIIIIQSIPDDEEQTGTEIYDDYIVRLARLEKDLLTEIVDINTKEELFNLLAKVKEETRSGESLPYLHFETHGTPEGIFLKSGEIVYYKDFIQIIREINILSKNNLFISIGACWGGRIQFETDIKQPCPFRGFIGPMEEIFPRDLIISFSSFFDELLRSDDFEKAINRLNLYNESGVTFNHYNAETFYDLVIEHLKKTHEGSTLEEKIAKDWTNYKWANDPNVRKKYITKSRFAKEVVSIAKNQSPSIHKRIRDNFLHINLKTIANAKK